MRTWLPAPTTAKRMFVAGWAIWVVAAVITGVSGSSSTIGPAAATLLAGLLFMPTGPLAFWDVEGFGSEWARRVPNGGRLDAGESPRLGRLLGAGMTVIAVGWAFFGAGLLLQSLR